MMFDMHSDTALSISKGELSFDISSSMMQPSQATDIFYDQQEEVPNFLESLISPKKQEIADNTQHRKLLKLVNEYYNLKEFDMSRTLKKKNN